MTLTKHPLAFLHTPVSLPWQRPRTLLALTGWGHPHNALHSIAPEAKHLEYTHLSSLEDALTLLADAARDIHTVVGWSMGGQLAALAVARRIIAPKKLVLIAAPYHFVARRHASIGLKPDIYAQFMDNLQRKPERTFEKAYALVHHGDTRADAVKEALSISHATRPAHNWEYWFSALKEVDFDTLDFGHFPRTHLLHGDADVVVHLSQSRQFAARIPRARVHVFKGCGHAPHWHDPANVRRLLNAS